MALALRDCREGLRRAIGSRVTLHVAAFFPWWRDGVRHGQANSLPVFGCQSSHSSTQGLLSNRTTVKVSLQSSPTCNGPTIDSTEFWKCNMKE